MSKSFNCHSQTSGYSNRILKLNFELPDKLYIKKSDYVRPLRKDINWKEVGKFALTHTVRECCKEFGFNSGNWSAAVLRGAVPSKAGVIPLSKLKSPLVKKVSPTHGQQRVSSV